MNAVTKQEFSPDTTVSQSFETSATVLGARAKAQIEAKYTIALKYPRNWDAVRQTLLNLCSQPSFSNNKSTVFKLTFGKETIYGFGIRFAEAAITSMRNIDTEKVMVYQDPNFETWRVSVTDLETNVSEMLEVTISRVVERSSVPEGIKAISQRKNSKGYMTYTVPANEEDMQRKRGAYLSKAKRTVALPFLPEHIKSACWDAIAATRRNEIQKNPEVARTLLIDGFFALGINLSQLNEFIGFPIGELDVSGIEDLRLKLESFESGEQRFGDALRSVVESRAAKSANADDVKARDELEARNKAIKEGKVASMASTGESLFPDKTVDQKQVFDMTYAQFEKKVNASTSRDALDEARDLKRSIDPKFHDEADLLIAQKLSELSTKNSKATSRTALE
jgi:hypothetical protein